MSTEHYHRSNFKRITNKLRSVLYQAVPIKVTQGCCKPVQDNSIERRLTTRVAIKFGASCVIFLKVMVGKYLFEGFELGGIFNPNR